MKTVKEISDLTGTSVCALHYYGEIELFTPTKKSEAGYRLYDDNALEILLQIQSKILIAKKEYIGCLTSRVDDILNGDIVDMNFMILDKTEMKKMFQTIIDDTSKNIKQI